MERNRRGWQTQKVAYRTVAIAAIVLSFSVFSACRFKFPSTREGQTFARQGVFTSTVPTWVKPTEDMDVALASKGGGIVPRSYASPEVVRSSRASLATVQAGDRNSEKIVKRRVAKRPIQTEADVATPDTVDAEDESPIVRIERICPGLEDEVSDALRTENLDSRISKYSALSNRCSNSEDIWLWLGKDYQSAGRYAEAIRCFDKALVIDPSNDSAKALLKVVRDKASGKTP